MTMNESTFVRHDQCPSCGSSDNLARYSDGHGYCFGCEHHERSDRNEPGEGEISTNKRPRVSGLIEPGEFRPLMKRGITEETCRKWGYTVGELGGKAVQIAAYRDDRGALVAQKVRFQNKDFSFLGDTKKAGLYGQHLWRDGGKMIVLTEGEIDALTVSQLQGNKWPVASVPTGAKGAKKAIAKALEWLENFETVVFMFDNDEQGISAAQECAMLLTPGKAKIAKLPLKDANAMLQADRGKEVIDAIWGSKVYRPDGIVSGNELWDVIKKEDESSSMPFPWDGLNEKTRGARIGQVVTFTAGSGIGKSAIVREIAHHLHRMEETIGMIMLEEDMRRTGLGLMGIEMNRPLHLDRDGVTETEMRAAFDATLGSGRIFLYDHFGSTEVDNLLSRVRYLAKGCGCRWVVLDHLSIVISGQEDGDERRLIDNTMTALKALAMECNICIFLVSHLKRPEGRGHENGAQTSLAQLRGSHAIAQLSDLVIGAERDQQGDNPNLTLLRVLKNRFSGETGEACWLIYDRETGRLTETSKEFAKKDAEAADEDRPF